MTRCSVHGQRPFTENKKKCLECEQLDEDDEKGTIYYCKEMVLMSINIPKFHQEFYEPAIWKLGFHLPHAIFLGRHHCGIL